MGIKILIGAVALVVGVAVGFIVGYFSRRKFGEAKISSAESEAKRIIEDGEKTAEMLKKEALIEAKEKIQRDKTEAERELKERRNEVTRMERRALSREDALEKKIESYERKEEALNRRMKDQEELIAKAEAVRQEQLTKLEAIAGLSRDEAREELVRLIEDDARHEAAMKYSPRPWG